MTKSRIPFHSELLSLHTAIVGKTRSGKTNSAKVIVEDLEARSERVAILDPIKSDWHGLTSSADGRSAGLPFKILGGPHGHIPLHGDAGMAVGKLVASGDLPLSIIDMADLGPRDFGKFYINFAEALFRNMTGVLYLVIEEAHIFAPKERVGGDDENMRLYWTKRLAEAGGSKGIRLIVCTQTVQKLHNEVLGACDPVIAHRMVLPAQIKPIKDWITAAASKDAAEEVAKSLPGEKTGEAWVYSGENQFRQRVQFPKCQTYDNSKTPTSDGKGVPQIKTAAVDVDALRSLLGEAVAQAEANDPKKLKQQIVELEKQLRLKHEKPAPPPDASIVEGLQAQITTLTAKCQRLDSLAYARRTRALKVLEFVDNELNDPCFELHAEPVITPTPKPAPTIARAATPKPPHVAADRGGNRASAAGTSEGGLNAAQQRILDALAWLRSIDIMRALVSQVALLAGMNYGGGYFNNTLGSLSTRGLVLRRNGTVELTAGGEALAAHPRRALSIAEYHAQVRSVIDKLKGGLTVRILDALVEHGPREITIGAVAELVGASVDGGYFNNSIGPLGTLGLIRRERGVVRPTEILFPPQLS